MQQHPKQCAIPRVLMLERVQYMVQSIDLGLEQILVFIECVPSSLRHAASVSRVEFKYIKYVETQ